MTDVSIREYARHQGISDTAVRKAIKNGRISKKPNGKINQEEADKLWDLRKDISKVRDFPNNKKQDKALNTDDFSPKFKTKGDVFFQAKTANEVIKAKTAQVFLDKLKNTLVDKKEVYDYCFDFIRQIRNTFINSPARYVPEMASKLDVDEHKLSVELEKYIRNVLTEISKSDFNP